MSDQALSAPAVRPPGGVVPALEHALLVAILYATLSALVLVVRNGFLPVQRPLTHALVFWGWLLAWAGAALGGAVVLLWGTFRLGRRRPPGWLVEAPARATALGVAAVVLLQNRRPVRLALAGLDGPDRYRLLLPAALVLGLLGLLLLALLPRRLRLPGRLCAVLAAAAFVGASWPAPAPPRPRATEATARPAAAAGAAPQRFLLYGVDGADWRYVDTLVARGEMPNLSALRERGAWGPLGTIARSSSPIIWNTIATGQTPDAHGVEGFTVPYLRGVLDPLPQRLATPKGLGFGLLEGWLQGHGFLHEAPVPSSARRVPAYWNLATRHGSPVSVLNWWATWPAEPVLGSLVSERMYFWRFAARGQWTPAERVTWPEDLAPRLTPLVMRPEEVTWERARGWLDTSPEEYAAMVGARFRGKTAQGEFRYLYSMFETNRRLALALLEHGRETLGRPPDTMVLERAVDIACHAALRESELVPPHPGSNEADRRRFGHLVSETYRTVDRALGEMVAAFGEGNVIVVSDHGFTLHGSPDDPASTYHHGSGPDGVFLASGPAFRPGRVEGLTVYDVLPLLLYLKGFPVAEDLPGHVPLEAFAEGFRAGRPVRTVATFGGRETEAGGAGDPTVDGEVLERLRALGYVE